MKTPYEMVLEFHQTFRLLPPPPNFEAIRRKMIRDEAEELLTADTPEKMHDWICDMIYFIQGGFVELGVMADTTPFWRITGHEEPDAATRSAWFGCVGDLMHRKDDQAEMLQHMKGLVESFAGMIGYHVADFKKDFAQVHAANMRKVWNGTQTYRKFVNEFKDLKEDGEDYFLTKDGWEVTRIGTSRWIVKHEGKIQKPPGWSLEGGVK